MSLSKKQPSFVLSSWRGHMIPYLKALIPLLGMGMIARLHSTTPSWKLSILLYGNCCVFLCTLLFEWCTFFLLNVELETQNLKRNYFASVSKLWGGLISSLTKKWAENKECHWAKSSPLLCCHLGGVKTFNQKPNFHHFSIHNCHVIS